ncbi:MAG: hypothetical protein UW22_C0015G0031 [Candidatus Gottesmanbacteria bacterium GW2011_GWB1_44_11c]|uniref:Uncharacterized protein n=1 Tax=Candidatus Gottesmanbacteria bacterium GW2011_GWB1_44_11c TaxID=1618447 RepID=A0A0G1GSE9_9BACT|nr:MAG: hypothetical protein UW22_C0015G0031 [Candidatus Gottesmanbacteria bacterium GW2011_GWB1_44_11c]
MNRFLKIILLVLVLIPALFLIITSQSSKNMFDWKASAYDLTGGGTPNPDTPPGCPYPCYYLDPTNPANECAGGQPNCDANVGGQDGEFYQDENGDYWFSPNDDDDDEGGGGGYNPPNIPTPPTPPPPSTGTIQVYTVTADTTSYLMNCDQLPLVKTCIDTPGAPGCDTIPGNKSYLIGTVTYLNGIYQDTQTDTTGSRFINAPSNYIYRIANSKPGFSSYGVCHQQTPPETTTWIEGNSDYLYPTKTITFIVGMGPILPWFQIQLGGNSYGDSVFSLMPLFSTQSLLFDQTSAPTSPGILSSFTGFDLSESQASVGLINISSTNWSTNNAMTAKDWYVLFSHRLAQAALVPYGEFGGKPDQVVGARYTSPIHDLTINQPWVVADGEKLIVIVDGTLDIRSTITIQGNGFVAFVVKNDITVNAAVGTTWDSTTPLVEGMYIAGGTFKTGTSTDPSTERFVGKGTFAAQTILLERNLSATDHNKDTSADLFYYNPSFLILMPDILKDLSYTWEEVAP